MKKRFTMFELILALVLTSLAVSVFAAAVVWTDTQYLDVRKYAKVKELSGGDLLGTTASFTTSDTADTVVNSGFAATDIFIVSLNDTGYGGGLKGWEAKAGTLFVSRNTNGTSAATYSYIRIEDATGY